MSVIPEFHELVWLFEAEPVFLDEDLGWPISRTTFTARRDQWEVRCAIEVYSYVVEIDIALAGEQVVHLKLNEDVDQLLIDRAGGHEVLVIRPKNGHDLGAVRLQLKPAVRLFAETVLP